jgi:hypothetical protein
MMNRRTMINGGTESSGRETCNRSFVLLRPKPQRGRSCAGRKALERTLARGEGALGESPERAGGR